MKSSRKLELSAEARLDLQALLRHTGKVWGERQRLVYGRRLAAAMDELTRFPELGKLRDFDLNGLRGRTIEQHVIYYRVTDETITVVRLLHVRMDVRSIFDPLA